MLLSVISIFWCFGHFFSIDQFTSFFLFFSAHFCFYLKNCFDVLKTKISSSVMEQKKCACYRYIRVVTIYIQFNVMEIFMTNFLIVELLIRLDKVRRTYFQVLQLLKIFVKKQMIACNFWPDH